MPDPRELLPTIFYSPVRLAILASLRTAQNAEFRSLAEAYDLSDQEMSRQLAILEKAGVIKVMKCRRGRRAVTQVRISSDGLQQFESYLRELSKVAFDEAGE